jgi:hypothetical protein
VGHTGFTKSVFAFGSHRAVEEEMAYWTDVVLAGCFHVASFGFIISRSDCWLVLPCKFAMRSRLSHCRLLSFHIRSGRHLFATSSSDVSR